MNKKNQIYWIIGIIVLFLFLAKSGVFQFMAIVNPDFSTDNLLSYYSFDVDAKDDYPFMDSDGIMHGAQITDGKINKAILFDGVDDYIEIDDSEQLKTQSISVAYWLKINSLGQTYSKIIEASYIDNCIAYGFTLMPDNKITFDIDTCISGITTSSTILNADSYYFIVGTYDGSEAKLYINGVLEDSSIIDKAITYDSHPVHIGTGHGASGEPLEFLDGTIDEASFYDVALTQEKITGLYNSGSGFSYLMEEPEPAVEYELRYVCENGNKVDDPLKCPTAEKTIEYICSDGSVVTSAEQCIQAKHIPIYIWILAGIVAGLFLYMIFGGKKNGKKRK